MTRFWLRNDHLNVAITLRLLCALAIAMIGFAHKPVFAAQVSAYEVSVLPDGEIAPMCLSSPEQGEKKAAGGGSCEACRLSAACALPAPPDTHAAVVQTVIAFRGGYGQESPPLDVLSYRGAPRASPWI